MLVPSSDMSVFFFFSHFHCDYFLELLTGIAITQFQIHQQTLCQHGWQPRKASLLHNLHAALQGREYPCSLLSLRHFQLVWQVQLVSASFRELGLSEGFCSLDWLRIAIQPMGPPYKFTQENILSLNVQGVIPA